MTPDPIDDDPDARLRRLSSCEGKSIFLSWARAHAKAREMTKRSHDRGERVICAPYRCDAGHIHIGSRPIITPPYRKPVRTHRRKGAHLNGYETPGRAHDPGPHHLPADG